MLSPIKILTMALAAAPFVISSMTCEQMVKNIKTLTGRSQALQSPARSINIINGPQIIIGLGPFPVRPLLSRELVSSTLTENQQIISGFAEIVSIATVSITMMEGSPPIQDAAQADAIADAFREVGLRPSL